jgi:predicted DNA-binding transcriptional regulator AlpA
MDSPLLLHAAHHESDILFIDDLATILRTSRTTIERRRRERAFPIPELPAIDNRPRWSRQAVDEFIRSSASMSHRSRSRAAHRPLFAERG